MRNRGNVKAFAKAITNNKNAHGFQFDIGQRLFVSTSARDRFSRATGKLPSDVSVKVNAVVAATSLAVASMIKV